MTRARRSLARPLVLGALAAGSLLATSPAVAAERCVGEASTFVVCVTTPTVTTGEQTYCVYAGGSRCTEVDVPTVGTTGEAGVECGGSTMWILMCAFIGNL